MIMRKAVIQQEANQKCEIQNFQWDGEILSVRQAQASTQVPNRDGTTNETWTDQLRLNSNRLSMNIMNSAPTSIRHTQDYQQGQTPLNIGTQNLQLARFGVQTKILEQHEQIQPSDRQETQQLQPSPNQVMDIASRSLKVTKNYNNQNMELAQINNQSENKNRPSPGQPRTTPSTYPLLIQRSSEKNDDGSNHKKSQVSNQANQISCFQAPDRNMTARNYNDFQPLIPNDIQPNQPMRQSQILIKKNSQVAQSKNRRKEAPVRQLLVSSHSSALNQSATYSASANLDDSRPDHDDATQSRFQQTQRIIEKLNSIKGIKYKSLKISGVNRINSRFQPAFRQSPVANTILVEDNREVNETEEEGDIALESSLNKNTVPAIHSKSAIKNQMIESNHQNPLNYESQEYLELQEQMKRESATAVSDRPFMNNGFIFNPYSEEHDQAFASPISEEQYLEIPEQDQIAEDQEQEPPQDNNQNQVQMLEYFELNQTARHQEQLKRSQDKSVISKQNEDIADQDKEKQQKEFEDLLSVSWDMEDVVSGTLPTEFIKPLIVKSKPKPKPKPAKFLKDQKSKPQNTFKKIETDNKEKIQSTPKIIFENENVKCVSHSREEEPDQNVPKSNLNVAHYIQSGVDKPKIHQKELSKQQRILKQQLDMKSFDPLKYLQSQFIICKKYNYQIHNTDSYQAKLSVSQDGKYLVLEKVSMTKHGNIMAHETNSLGFQHRSKLPLSKITGFMYGGVSTRFQMQRQGILQIISALQNKNNGLIDQMVPHYEWECLSIQFQNKDLDIVIRDEFQMEVMLKLLIKYLNTFDGNKDSVKFLHKQRLLPKNVTVDKMLNRICFGYKLMKFRMKLAFESCKRCRTVQEHIIQSIVMTYYDRIDKGLIEDPYPPIDEKAMDDMMKSNLVEITNKKKSKAQQVLELKGAPDKLKSLGSLMKGQALMRKSTQKKIIQKVMSKSVPRTIRIDEMYKDYLQNLEPWSILSKREQEHQKIDELRRKDITSRLQQQINKLQLIIKLNMVEGPAFCILLLESIRLQKLLFVAQLQDGIEKNVPNIMFNRKETPTSFQYYDWVFMIIKQNVECSYKEKIMRRCLSQDHQERQETSKQQSLRSPFQSIDSLSDRLHSKLLNVFKSQDQVSTRIFEQQKFFQSGRYIKINQTHLNQQIIDLKHINNADFQQKDPEFFLFKGKNGDFQQLVKSPHLKNQKQIDHNILEEYEVDIEYLTSQQVRKKRNDFYQKKFLFQKQLTNLKEKGKRLKKIDQLKGITRNAEDTLNANAKHRKNLQTLQLRTIQNHLKKLKEEAPYNEQFKEKLFKKTKKLYEIIDNFDQKSIPYQEQAQANQRKKLMRELAKCSDFVQRNEKLDKKIEFDQRFFNDNYDQFQLMISNVRKQIKLNEDILKIRSLKQKHVEELGEENISVLNQKDELQKERLKNFEKMQKQLESNPKNESQIISKDINTQQQQEPQTEQQQQKAAAEQRDPNSSIDRSFDSSDAEEFDVMGKAVDMPVMQQDPGELKKLLKMQLEKQATKTKSCPLGTDIKVKKWDQKEQDLKRIEAFEEKIEKRKMKITEISKIGQKGYSWGKECRDQFDAQLHQAIAKKFEKLFDQEELDNQSQASELPQKKRGKKLSSQEEESIMRLTDQLFIEYDNGQDNQLDRNETKVIFQDIFDKLGSQKTFNVEIFERIFQKFDDDGSGFIGKNEMTQFIRGLLLIE